MRNLLATLAAESLAKRKPSPERTENLIITLGGLAILAVAVLRITGVLT